MAFKDAFKSPATSLDDQMESYATTRVPQSQRWPAFAILLILTGNVTAMFWFTLGGQISFLVGWPNMLLPIGYLIVVSTILGSLVMRIASKEGLSLVLLTRGLGFGAKGSAIASFVYGINYIFYFIFEGSIVSHALSQYFGIGQGSATASVIFALVGAAALFFAWRGMHSMNILQRFGMPIFIALFILGMFMLADGYAIAGPGQWVSLSPDDPTVMWQAFSLVNGQIVFQALLATDYGRFSKTKIGYRGTAGIMFGELVMIAIVMVLGSMLAYTLLPTLTGDNPQLWATDPGFAFALIMGFIGVVFTIITQIRINVMNLYSGSLAFANTWDAFARRPIRRSWWMIGILVLGIVLYPINVLQYTDTFLAVTGIMTNTWIFILLADYFICRKLLRYASVEKIEYQDHEVRKWNPCGISAMLIAVLVGAAGVVGIYPVYYASFAAMLVGPVIHVVLTVISRGKFYSVVPAPVVSVQE